MTHQTDYSLSPELVAEITRNGLQAVPEMLRVLINNLMQAERMEYLHAEEYDADVIFEEEPGGHDWNFWDTYIQRVLECLPTEKVSQSAITGNEV